MNPSCMVIAEAGVNHNGSLDLAYRLVDAAVAADADYVKFQIFQADKLASRDAPKAAYQRYANGDTESQFDMLKRLELPRAAFREIAAYCADRQIGFLATPFDEESLFFLSSLGLRTIKISSGDLTDRPLLQALGGMSMSVLLSTGMATLGEVEDALGILEAAGTPFENITLLHCTTEYPAPDETVNLRAMATMAAAFPRVSIGYSDHTEGIDIALAAVALGACVIEKHFTLDRAMAGPDHQASLEPPELARLVAALRRVAAALGDGRKRPAAIELPNRLVARKSIVASRPIRQGELLSLANLTVRRPGTGISPMRWEEVLGRPALRAYAADEPI